MVPSCHGIPADLESKLWTAADKLRGHMDAAEYKHVVLGLIFLKYISDAFLELYNQLQKKDYADPEDRDEYLAENIFWVPKEARWQNLQQNAKSPEIGVLIDKAMAAIERDNASLKGVLPQDYGREDLDKRRLGELYRPHQHHCDGRQRKPLSGHSGARVRSLLWERRHVRTVGEVYRGTRRQRGRHLRVRTGKQPDHLAFVQDEPRHPGH